MDNKLSIHFDKDKTKLILFASKQRLNNVHQLNIKYKHVNIKQHSQVTYLGCVLNKTISDEPVALKIIYKINGTLKLLCRKNRYLTKEVRRMLCNAFIQPQFDYAVSGKW